MAQKIVSSQAELQSALTTVKSGDTIFLNDGNYGSLTMTNRKYASDVTIAAVNEGGAVFSKIDIRNGHNIVFSGVTATQEFRAWYGSEGITVDGVKTAQFYFRDVNDLLVDHSEATGGWYNLILNETTNFVVRNSYFHDASEDVSRVTGNSYNGLFENNIFADTDADRPIHPDLMQLFAFNGTTPHDITIRGNLFYDDIKTGDVIAQGIFLGGPGTTGFSDILIEQNLIATRHPNTIYVNGGQENVVIRNNTLMGYDESNGGVIRLAEKDGFDNSGTIIHDNVVKVIYDETESSDIGENYVYGKGIPAGKIFNGTLGDKWQDYLSVDGDTIINGDDGAIARLKAIMASGSFWSSQYHSPVSTIDEGALGAFEPVYMREGTLTFNGNLNKVIALAPDKALELDEGTLSFSFNTDVTGWRRTLVSKDAVREGDHFSVMLENGTLKVSFGDESKQETISVGGIKAKQDYDFVTSFDDGHASAWLDGKLIGKVAIDMDWSDNHEPLLIGADNSASTSGTANAARYAYDGTMTNFFIEDQAMTAKEVHSLLTSIGLS